jgi:hypothetical protein
MILYIKMAFICYKFTFVFFLQRNPMLDIDQERRLTRPSIQMDNKVWGLLG